MRINANIRRIPQNICDNICGLLPDARQFDKFRAFVIFLRKNKFIFIVWNIF